MNDIFSGKHIVVFGTGAMAKNLTGTIEYLDGKVSSYIDNNTDKWGTQWLGRIVQAPSWLTSIDKESIAVLIGSSYYSEISSQLRSLGLTENEHFFGTNAIYDRIYDSFAQKKLSRITQIMPTREIERYVRPDDVDSRMGGTDEVLDERLSDVIQLMSDFDLESLGEFLDVGMGRGQLAKWIADKGNRVTGTGINIDSYDVMANIFKQEYGINIVECSVEKMPFPDSSFDGVVMSHVLEHCPNVGLALQETWRVLKDDGLLFIFVPPPEDIVCSGHISVGWNVGQLIYVLLLNGFDVKTGSFARYNYNVCAVVRKGRTPLPPLRGDYGDLHILNQHNLLPLSIVTPKGIDNAFWGDLESINWPTDRFLIRPTYLRGYIPSSQ